jgi:hypothetical protein
MGITRWLWHQDYPAVAPLPTLHEIDRVIEVQNLGARKDIDMHVLFNLNCREVPKSTARMVVIMAWNSWEERFPYITPIRCNTSRQK